MAVPKNFDDAKVMANDGADSNLSVAQEKARASRTPPGQDTSRLNAAKARAAGAGPWVRGTQDDTSGAAAGTGGASGKRTA